MGVLSAHAVLCGGLAWWCGRASGVAPERRLPRACWLALAGGGAALATTLPAWSPGAAAEGAVHVVWAVFAAYALLPVGAPAAAAFGIILPTVHTIAAALVAHRFPHHVWQQVSYLHIQNWYFSKKLAVYNKTPNSVYFPTFWHSFAYCRH